MLTVATLFWQPNKSSFAFSSMYDEAWVEKLYRGFRRNLTQPFNFVCYTDKLRKYQHWEIGQKLLKSAVPGYGDCIQPYEMNEPMILVGLDTIVCGNIDHLADYCLQQHRFALPRDPYKPERACNGVALVPAGHGIIAEMHRGENDMVWVRKFPHAFIDDWFPGEVLSFKEHYKRGQTQNARIVYFHGEEKPHQLLNNALVRNHWR